MLVIYDLLNKEYPNSSNLQKNLKLVCMPRFGKSPAGIPVGPNSSNPKDMARYDFMYSTPMPVYDILTEPETIYLHLLFALSDRNLGMIEANFVHLVYIAMQHLKAKWPQLVSDIRLGKIDPDLDIEPGVRRQLQKLMVANPQRANELHVEFLKGFDGIIKRIWPRLYCILSVDTGAFSVAFANEFVFWNVQDYIMCMQLCIWIVCFVLLNVDQYFVHRLWRIVQQTAAGARMPWHSILFATLRRHRGLDSREFDATCRCQELYYASKQHVFWVYTDRAVSSGTADDSPDAWGNTL